MKKIISLMLVVLVFCAFAFTGCSDKISKDTKPEDITSTKVTEKEWREACSFIGMRDRFYELKNEVSYKIMKKVNCKIYEKVLNENKNFEFECEIKTIEAPNKSWACQVTVKGVIDGQEIMESYPIGQPNNQSESYKSHAYEALDDITEMEKVVDLYNEFAYDEEKGGYCKTYQVEDFEHSEGFESFEVILKFEKNRLVCYQQISSEYETTIVFYSFK